MRAKEFEKKITREFAEPETVYQQDIGVGTPQATNSVGTNADTNIKPDHDNAVSNAAIKVVGARITLPTALGIA